MKNTKKNARPTASVGNANNKTLLHQKLNFAATEAYKLLRANLLFTLHGKKKCRVVGVTSSVRGEGKSTTAINLSYTLAETGKRVLLIDGDLRLPSVAKKLGIKGSPGLSNLLVGDSTKEQSILKSTDLDTWFILPSGDIPPNPTEMLGSDALEQLIHDYSEDYDFIVVDLPPVNIVSDALVISPLVDGMVVVVRENYSERRALKNCTRQLTLSNVKILGFVMNVTSDGATGYGRNKRYKYYKYYKYNSKYYKSYGNYYKRESRNNDESETKENA